MKKLIYILTATLILIYGCTEPNPGEPGTDSDVLDNIDYEILFESKHKFQVDEINEVVIRDREELNQFMTERAFLKNLEAGKLLDFDFEDHILIAILASGKLGDVHIDIDTLEIKNKQLHIKYSILETIRGSIERTGSMVFLKVKLKKKFDVRFRSHKKTESEVDDITDFTTLFEDMPIKSPNSWRSVIKTKEELIRWMLEHDFKGQALHNLIDFNKEMIITVGLPVIQKGKYKIRINDLRLENNRIKVYSKLEIIDQEKGGASFNNHFIKIPKTDFPIEFNSIDIVQNYLIGSELYYDFNAFSTMGNNLEEAKATIIKDEESFKDQFQNLSKGQISQPEIDFQIFDVVLIQFPEIKGAIFDIRIKKFRLEKSGIRLDVLLEHQKQGAHMRQAPVLVIRKFKSPFDISEFEYEVKEE